MTTYKTDRPNIKKYLLYQLLSIVCVLLVLVICEYVFPQYRFFRDSNYRLYGIVTIIAMFFEIKRERVYEISFDHDKKQISFYYKTSAFSKLKKYDLSYDVARVEKGESSILIQWLASRAIYFFKNKLEIFEISKRKDGFSKTTLDEIYNNCVQVYQGQKSL